MRTGWWLRRFSAQVTPVVGVCRVPVASRKSPPEFVGGGVLVAGELEGEQAVEVAGDDGQGGVEVDVERDAGGEGVEVEAADVGVELVLDHHPLGVAGEQVLGGVIRSLVISRVGWSRPMLRDGDLADLGADVR